MLTLNELIKLDQIIEGDSSSLLTLQIVTPLTEEELQDPIVLSLKGTIEALQNPIALAAVTSLLTAYRQRRIVWGITRANTRNLGKNNPIKPFKFDNNTDIQSEKGYKAIVKFLACECGIKFLNDKNRSKKDLLIAEIIHPEIRQALIAKGVDYKKQLKQALKQINKVPKDLGIVIDFSDQPSDQRSDAVVCLVCSKLGCCCAENTSPSFSSKTKEEEKKLLLATHAANSDEVRIAYLQEIDKSWASFDDSPWERLLEAASPWLRCNDFIQTFPKRLLKTMQADTSLTCISEETFLKLADEICFQPRFMDCDSDKRFHFSSMICQNLRKATCIAFQHWLKHALTLQEELWGRTVNPAMHFVLSEQG